MCFSASASFTVGAFLLSSGVYCLNHLGTKEPKYVPMMSIPILFGIQQVCEGMVWQEMNNPNSNLIKIYALGFLFFSHCLWLFWMTIACLAVETRPIFKRILGIFAILGSIYGSIMYFPLLLNPERLSVNVFHGSIEYQTQLWGQQLLPWYLGIFIYAGISLIPLLISENIVFQNLGWLILVALVFCKLVFTTTVVSVWCFFAAIISTYLVYACFNDWLLDESKVVSDN